MSIIELTKRKQIVELIKLYLKESPNNFTMDEPNFGNLISVKTKTSKSMLSLRSNLQYDGFVTIKDKFSPVKMILQFSDIYKWAQWRVYKFLPARYRYFEKCNIESTTIENLPIKDLKRILRKTHV